MKLRMICFSIVLTLHVSLMLTVFMNIKAYATNTLIIENKAIEIANKEAKKIGYDIESMNVKTAHYKTPSNEYLPDSEEKYYVDRRSKLENKEYWAIYYFDPKLKKGGDICIFIDSSSGEVITSVRGK